MEATPLRQGASAKSESAKSESAMTSLFRVERDGLVRMATLMVGSAAVAEEVVQDAFVAISPRWASLEKPGAYLRTTVVNGCAQVLRRRSAEQRALESHPPHAPVMLPTNLVEIRDALDKLNDRQRLVVVLRYFVDMHDDDIAEALGVRPSSVRSLARRALTILRKELS